jgi:uncharacterized membrane protein YeaQ/YmgE (transglycosylase-associated protein family)
VDVIAQANQKSSQFRDGTLVTATMSGKCYKESGLFTHSPRGAVMIWNLISFIILGLIAGALARLVVPGKDPMSLPMTAVIGIVGSFIGGFLGYLIGHNKGEGGLQASGIIGSVIGAVIVLLVWRKFGRDRLGTS